MVALRRTVQVLSLLLFLFLLLTTRPIIEDNYYRPESPIWPYLYFNTNPLTYVSAVASSKYIPAINYIPLLVMLALVLLLGRFFCGWVCPLGVMIDGAAKFWKPPKKPKDSKWVPSPNLKIYILLIVLVTALFGVNIVGFFDPITIAFRSLAFAIQPYLEWVIRAVFDPLWQVPGVSSVSEPTYSFLKKYYLTPEQPHYTASAVYLLILLGIFGLSKIRRRYWCRYLCPLGAMHALLGRFGLWRKRVSPACTDCTVCGKICRTEAIDMEDFTKYDTRECIMCMDCRKICPENAIEFTFVPSTESVRVSNVELQVSRRGLLTAIGASLVALPLVRATARSRSDEVTLLRPPGAADEKQFLARCIRCGECMRACPQFALQPALLQFGLERMWTPVLTPRIGYCEFNCTLCMQVCPTGALEVLTQRAKQQFRMGTAFFDKNRCIPWAENSNCLVCEEVCPTSKKAIHMRDEVVLDDTDVRRVVKRPYIIEDYCIGCGTCEFNCPVEGLSAIRVAPRYESRSIEKLDVGGGFVDTGGDLGGDLEGDLGDDLGVVDEPTTKTDGGPADPYGGAAADPYGGGGRSSDPYK